MYVVYILKSKPFRKYYVGHTENLDNRLSRYNRGLIKSTKKFIPWSVIYTEFYNSGQEAYKRELQIKSNKGGRAFRKLIKK